MSQSRYDEIATGRPPRAPRQGVCHACGQPGHYAASCPTLRRNQGRGPPLSADRAHPPPPADGQHGQYGQRVNAGGSQGRALDANFLDVDVLPVVTRSRAEAHLDEEEETVPAPKLRRRTKGAKPGAADAVRRIRCGVGHPVYNVTEDIFKIQANLSIGQLLQLSPAARRMLREGLAVERKPKTTLRGGTAAPTPPQGRATDPRGAAPRGDTVDPQVDVSGQGPSQGGMPGPSRPAGAEVPVMTIEHEQTLWTEARVAGAKIGRAIVDPGGMVNLMNLKTATAAGLKSLGPADIRIRVGDGRRHALAGFGFCDVEVEGVISHTKFYFIDADTNYEVLLGKPWIRGMRTVSDWATDTHIIKDDSGNVGVVKGRRADCIVAAPQWVVEAVPREEDDGFETQGEEETDVSGSEEEFLVTAWDCEGDEAGGSCESEGPAHVAYVHPELDAHYISTENVAELDIGTEISAGERRQVEEMLVEHGYLFAHDLSELRQTSMVEFRIDEIPGAGPCCVKNAKRLSPEIEAFARKRVAELLAAKLITEDDGPYASHCSFPRKGNGEYRMCHNYMRLNAQSIKQKWPIPSTEECLDRLAGHKYFTSIDGFSGYFVIPVRESDKAKTAFITPFGKYKYNVMPFGVVSGPATYARLNSKVFGDLIGHGVEVFFDDLGIATISFEEHIQLLGEVLRRYSDAGMSINPKKCHFFKDSLSFVGHVIDKDGIHPDNCKVQKIFSCSVPETKTELRSFLGLASYYRRFVENFAGISHPLVALTRQGVPWQWGILQQESFDKLKTMMNSPGLVLLPPRYSQKWFIFPHSSDVAVGAAVCQHDDAGQLRPVYFLSNILSSCERNYSCVEKSVLSVVWTLQKLRHYFIDAEIEVYSRDDALKWLVNKQEVQGRLLRWLTVILEYDVVVKKAKATDDAVVRYLGCHEGIGGDGVKTIVTAEVEDAVDALPIMTEDPWYSAIVKYLTHLDFDDSLDSAERRKVSRKSRDFVISNGKLWYKHPEGRLLRAVKSEAVDRVVSDAHSGVCGGHYSSQITLWKVAAEYYWPTMRADVKEFCSRCHTCQSYGRKGLKAPNRPLVASAPFQLLGIDFIGPLPRSRGKRFVLAAIDYMTRWVEATSLKRADSKSVVKFLDLLSSRFGIPGRIISDNGSAFISEQVQQRANSLGINWMFTAPYMPKSNGMIERCNGEIIQRMKRFCFEHPRGWASQLDNVLWAIRTALHSSLGCSPAEVLMGFKPRAPAHGQPGSETWAADLLNSTAELELPSSNDLQGRMMEITLERDEVRDRDEGRRRNPDRCEREQQGGGCPGFRIGDLVMVRSIPRHGGEFHKFAPKWNGPFQVKARMGVLYEVETLNGSLLSRVLHCDQLKLYYQ